MPTYEFRCPDGHDFEKFYRSIGTAPAEVLCPTCGKAAARQLSAGGGLLFRGSGFYITDYGKDGKKSQAAVPAASGIDSKKPAAELPSGMSESSGSEKPATGSSPDSGARSPSESKPAAPSPAKKPKSSE